MSLAAEQTSLVVRPLSPALGAEIVGVDLRQELPAETVAAMLDAWHRHLVLLFRNQSLSEDEQIVSRGISAAAGAHPAGRGAQRSRAHQTSRSDDAGSNIRENGKLIGSLPDGEMHFHSDQCYLEKPANGTFLYAIEIPGRAAIRCSSTCTRPTRRCRPTSRRASTARGAQRLHLRLDHARR